VRPVRRVGVYAPGGTAAYVSTVLMDVIPALVAGCPEIVLCSSPKPGHGGAITPVLLAACKALSLREVYRVGGAQAVLAMAIGTASIPRVDMICGPGNAWVTEAKRWAQSTGRLKIDKLAGPTEVLIIADESADPTLVAADLLAQAEHDAASRPLLVTTHPPLIEAVETALREQLAALPRREIAETAVRTHGLAILVPSLESACEAANAIAPEHLEILTRAPESLVDAITEAGAIFLGPWSPEALGDYVAGPNHVLPTMGQARFASPLSVHDFVKWSSLLHIGPKTFAALAGPTMTLAEAEGLQGHARSIEERHQKQ
jgi:histidinol dehydrogenase